MTTQGTEERGSHRSGHGRVPWLLVLVAALLVAWAIYYGLTATRGAERKYQEFAALYQPTPQGQATPSARGNPEKGKALFLSKGCTGCHTVASLPGARGAVGPDLSTFALRPNIAGALPNTRDNLARWLTNPQEVKPGTGMPNLGLTASEVQDLVAFLEGLAGP